MSVGVIARKCGMTGVFTEEGEVVQVTVVHVEPNRITQVKTCAKEGYDAIQVTTGAKRPNRLNQAEKGHFAKAGVLPGRGLWEFRLETPIERSFSVGDELTVSLFQTGQSVKVAGKTKGKGFAGTIKRHHFSAQRASHGNSLSHRVPGSIGQNQSPGRVFKGKKMAGHLGDTHRTIRNLKVFRVDEEKNMLLIRGSVPGAPGGNLLIYPVVKALKKIRGA